MNAREIPIPADIAEVVAIALKEDIGRGDITAELIPEASVSEATVICRETAILCGVPWFNEVFKQLDERVSIDWQLKDGDKLKNNDCVCQISGPTRSLLTGERTALNFLQLLSGTASITHDYAQIIASCPTEILDTRKTVPGLRTAQKYAVACGGGRNHRIGLYDAVLIKENHIIAAGGITEAVHEARKFNTQVEVEVESLEELKQAIAAAADIVLIDNFSLTMMREAVELAHGQVKLEASGGVDEKTLLDIAKTGVDYISIGALTKHVRAIDFSMRMID